MTTFFAVCAGLGALILIVQILGGFAGVDLPDAGEVELGAALELLSVRSLSAGVGAYGVAGLGLAGAGVSGGLAAALALLPGLLAAWAVAAAMRQMLRLESDGSLRLQGAVGESGTVYLPVPAHSQGAGKVQLALQGRTIELPAVTREPRPIATGTAVVVVALLGDDTVEVLPTSIVGDLLDADR